MSILNKTVSYFPSVRATESGVDANLITILQSDKHKKEVENIRLEQDPQKRQLLKIKLPCFTVSGRFSKRCENGLIELSGLAAIDMDSAENYNTLDLLSELKKIPHLAYAGLSCSGSRLFCIIPFAFPDKYQQQYSRLIRSFEDIGLPLGDDCHKRISQPRYFSYNSPDTCFFNHCAIPYDLVEKKRIYHYIKLQTLKSGISVPNHFGWCEAQIKKSQNFEKNSRHNFILKLARYCNLKGLSKEETLDGCISYQEDDFSQKEIESIVKYIYNHQSNSHNKLPLK